MTWVRIDDQFPDHPKVAAVGPQAAWLHVCGLCYAARYLTDGFVPDAIVSRLTIFEDVTPLVTLLVTHALWAQVDGGYMIHDFLEYNPSREQVMQEREAGAKRISEWRKRKKSSRNASGNAVTPPPSNAVSNTLSNGVPGPYPMPHKDMASAKNADARQPLDLPKAEDQMAVLFPQSGNGVGDVMRDVSKAGWTIRQQDALRAVALFLAASKLPIPNDTNTRKDWLKAVYQQLTDFGVGVLERAYPLAVRQMMADGLTVSRPGSLTKTLPAIVKAMRTKPPPRAFTTESIYDDDAAQGDTS